MANIEASEPQVLQSSQLADFIQKINESKISDIVESIPYNAQSQKVAVQLRDLLRRESKTKVWVAQCATLETLESGKEATTLAELSRNYHKIALEFLDSFDKWRSCRHQLVRELKTCADQLERNSMLSSGFRLLASTTGLVSTLMRRLNKDKPSWAISVLEYASEFGFASFFLEQAVSVRWHKEIKSLVDKDQALFQPITKWIEQCEELNTAVQNFFPYGIDENLVLKIHRYSSTSDEYSKIFMSVIASNARNNIQLFTNKDFLGKADMFSTSQAGIHWYHTIVTKRDPAYMEFLKPNLYQEIYKLPSSVVNKLEFFSSTPFLFVGLKMRIVVNCLAIYLSAFNILDNGKTDESEVLRELARQTQRELEAMENILTLMKQNGIKT